MAHEIGTRGNRGRCVEVHDLAASKLAAFREKDREFVTTLLVEEMIDSELLLERVRGLPEQADLIAKLEAWIRRTVTELSQG